MTKMQAQSHVHRVIRGAVVLTVFLALFPLSAAVSAAEDTSITIKSGMAAPMPILPPGDPPPNTIIPRFVIDTINDATAGPGESVTLRGRGFPAGESYTATLHETGALEGASGGLMGNFSTDSNGDFVIQADVPSMLRGPENLYVLPGQYMLRLSPAAGTARTAPFEVGAPRHGALIWGDLSLNTNQDSANVAGVSDVQVAGVIGVGLGAQVGITSTDGHQEPAMLGATEQKTTLTDDRGRYMFWVPAGAYALHAATSFGGSLWQSDLNIQANQAEVQNRPLMLELGR